MIAEAARVHVLAFVLLGEFTLDRLDEATRADVPQLKSVAMRPRRCQELRVLPQGRIKNQEKKKFMHLCITGYLDVNTVATNMRTADRLYKTFISASIPNLRPNR